MLMLAPSSVLETLKVKSFVDHYSDYIALTFLLTTAILVIELISYLWSKFALWRSSRASTKEIRKTMNNLDRKELAVLREFVIQEQNTLTMPIDHEVVAGLMSKGVLVYGGRVGNGFYFPVQISEVVKEMVTTQFVGLPAGKPTAEEVIKFNRQRPEFMRAVEEHKWLNWS